MEAFIEKDENGIVILEVTKQWVREFDSSGIIVKEYFGVPAYRKFYEVMKGDWNPIPEQDFGLMKDYYLRAYSA